MFNTIIDARKRLKGHANITPVMTSGTLNKLVGASVYLKCENFQKIGAFKFRGAFNSISKLSNKEKSKGVITYSSGNHAQAVALVGKMLNIQTTIVMPDNAPATKLADDATKSFKTKTLHTVKNPDTIADGTRTSSLGKITFPLVLEYVDDMITVSERNIISAVQFLFFRMKLVVEPSGVLGLAALLSKKINPEKKTGIILSGGNIDAKTMGMILNT